MICPEARLCRPGGALSRIRISANLPSWIRPTSPFRPIQGVFPLVADTNASIGDRPTDLWKISAYGMGHSPCTITRELLTEIEASILISILWANSMFRTQDSAFLLILSLALLLVPIP